MDDKEQLNYTTAPHSDVAPEGDPPLHQTKPEKPGTSLYFWLQSIAVPLLCLILIFTFIGRAVRVDGSSMDPTLADGELLLIWSLGYNPSQGDIVIASIPSCDLLEGAIVKRVIATEGQSVVVDYNNNTVTVDGVRLEEDYILEDMDQIYTATSSVMAYQVPEGHVFLMGDNRNHSTDSLNPLVGYVDESCLMGQAMVVVFPFDKWGMLT